MQNKNIFHHIHKRGHKIADFVHHSHHHLCHLGELAIVGFLCIANLTSAGFTSNTGLITDHTIVANNLITATNQGQMRTSDAKIISMREMDSSVENSFYPGYCTYGAARISPEFFPYSGSNAQIRTWGGNAKDRCENAQATGYKIGSTPAQGALVVYSKIGNSTLFGHVGKVMYYNGSKQSLIVRDMNRAGKGIMTDRRESTTNENIKCYIYNRRTEPVLVDNQVAPVTTIAQTPVITPKIPTTAPILIATNSNNPEVIKAVIPTVKTIVPQPIPSPTVVSLDKGRGSGAEEGFVSSKQVLPIITQPIPLTTVEEKFVSNNITLNFDTLSDRAEHFITQRDVTAKLTGKKIFQIGDTQTFTIEIKGKNTHENFAGLLDLPLELIASNSNIQTNYSLIQLIKDGKIEITITAKNKGDTTLLINFGGEKIGKINFSVE